MTTQYRPDASALLDAGAIERLRELDPGGHNRLLERVLGAFRMSLERLIPKIRVGRHDADADAVRLVAHTLKSSAASVGALQLSQLCGELESELRQGAALSGLDEQVDEVLREAQRVLAVLPSADTPAP